MRELTERDKAALIDSIPESDLVLFCPGLQGHGATLLDRSQYGNNGSLVGITWKRRPSGFYMNYLDGTGPSIDFGNNAILNFTSGNFTFLVGMIITAAQWHVLLSRGNHQESGYQIFVGPNNSLTLRMSQAGASQITGTDPDVLTTNKLYVVSCVRDGVKGYIYVDKTQVATSQPALTDPATSVNSLLIGNQPNGWTPYKGYVGLEIGIKRALSGVEVARISTRMRLLLGA